MENQSARVPPELEDVANQIGDFIEYWGFKNVHGRLWAHLYVSPTPLDASQLMERLKISKALVSMSLSDLLEYEVVQIAGKSERSTVTYRINPHITTVITNVLRKRERRLLCRIAAAARLLKDLPTDDNRTIPLAAERTQSLYEMVRSAEAVLDGMLSMQEVDFSVWSKLEKAKLE